MNYDEYIFGCAFSCPKNIEREMDCPFNEIVNLSLREKKDWMNNLAKDKKVKIIKHHLNCTLKNNYD